MQNIINRIYQGEICPRENWLYHIPEYKKNFHRVAKLKDKLRKHLDDRNFERLTLAYATCEDIALREKFAEGFKLGLRIAAEAYFIGKPELLEKSLLAEKGQK